ncbi:carbohydrate ABC transporter permease [Paenibacillus sp.]|uniref:carbohydrate ABC transporter permease n=1 Tax=Paenibacillus sp. TaxID=58172 RepID=UPI002D2BF2D2|nr:carbohydrate ABC transporter permease [Paenibacillus sp.]HZG83371.1 carbohydrate ABC transporter permease [Paenibacillus sp.]
MTDIGLSRSTPDAKRVISGFGEWFGRAFAALLLLGLAVSVVFPFVWLLLSTFKNDGEIIQYPPKLFPGEFTISQYVHVWESIPLLSFLRNTLIFSVSVTVISLFIDSMAGYAFARYRFPGRGMLFAFILISMMIPFQVIMIPLFVEVYKLGMLNTFIGLILPRAASAFGIYMMRAFFVSLPKELEESARIDGLREFGIYWRIMMPLCTPALITLAIIHFMGAWNDLLYPLMLTSSTEMRTLSAGLAMFVGERVIQYGPTLAAAFLSILPLLIAFGCVQQYFIRGVAMTGLKG